MKIAIRNNSQLPRLKAMRRNLEAQAILTYLKLKQRGEMMGNVLTELCSVAKILQEGARSLSL